MRIWDQSQGQRDHSQTGYRLKHTTHFCGCAAGRIPRLTTFWEMGWVEHRLFLGSRLRESWQTNPSISALGLARCSLQEILASSFFNLAFISVISLDSSAFLVDAVSAFVRAFLRSSNDHESLSESAVIWTDIFSTFSNPELVARNFTYSVEMAGWFSNWCSTYVNITS
jgi:hypothetical protein